MIQARKLKGFRDLNAQDMELYHRIVNTLRNNATLAGFREIQTPALEYAEVLLGSGGDETDKEVYRFTDHGERSVAMRFDLTVPFARYVAEHQSQLTLPFRKLQVGQVWRGEKPQKGRYREFCQADVDIVGVDSMLADYEVLAVLATSLEAIVQRPFTMAIGHRQILSALIRHCIPSIKPEQESQILIALDKLEKIGQEKVMNLLSEQGFATQDITVLLGWLQAPSHKQNLLGDLRKLWQEDSHLTEHLDRLEQTQAMLGQTLSSGLATVNIDLRIARGLGYYTGIVFETTIDQLPNIGSISSGGRYNQLVSRFSKQELPGVGGSLGVDRLMAALQELTSPNSTEITRHGVFIAIAESEACSLATELSQALRKQGLRCETTLKPGKLNQQFRYADRQRYQFVVTLGQDELASQTFSCKDLGSGQESKQLSRSALQAVLYGETTLA